MNIEKTTRELRSETARPEAKLAALRAMAGGSKRMFGWRVAAVGGACALLLVPVILRRESGASYAASLQEMIRASANAPIAHEVTTYMFRTRLTKAERWTAGPRSASKLYKDNRVIFDSRRDRLHWFMRVGEPPYEVVSRFQKAESRFVAFNESPYKTAALLREYLDPKNGVKIIETRDVKLNDRDLRRYRVSRDSAVPMRISGLPTVSYFYADEKLGLIVRWETVDNAGKLLMVSDIDYPQEADASLFKAPPLSDAPRFVQEVEEKALLDSAAKAPNVDGVRLLAAFQDPRKDLWVLWEGERPGADTKHPVRVVGGAVSGRGHKVRTKRPYITAAGIKMQSKVSRVDLDVPVYTAGKFVSYARFKNVPVRQSLPVYSLQYVLAK